MLFPESCDCSSEESDESCSCEDSEDDSESCEDSDSDSCESDESDEEGNLKFYFFEHYSCDLEDRV